MQSFAVLHQIFLPEIALSADSITMRYIAGERRFVVLFPQVLRVLRLAFEWPGFIRLLPINSTDLRSAILRAVLM
jgi:hypothetical protein